MTLLSAERVRRPESALTVRATAITLAALALLFLPGVLAFGPVFGGFEGYVAAGGGVLVGGAIGVVSRRRRWSLASTFAVTIVAYLLFGGVLALRRTTLLGFIPTPDTLLRLLPLTVQSWRDLLTVSPPANNFVGPAVVPYLSGLVLGLIAVRLGLRERRYLWAFVPTAALLLIGILWGLDQSPLAAALGVGFGATALLWAVWRQVEAGRAGSDDILIGGSSVTDGRRRFGGAAAVVGAVTAAALLATSLLGAGVDRQVLRQRVQPPLNLTDYASPLTSYRYLELDQKDVALFVVSGLPAGARIRLAALDAYDGHVYNVADASAGFLRMGERTGVNKGGTPITLDVTMQEYEGVWVPGGGDVRGLKFTGPKSQRQAENLYYNAYGGTLLTTAGVGAGDAYTVDLVLPTAVDDKAVGPLAEASEPTLDRVPDVIGKTATELAGDVTTPIEQLRNIEKALQQGYYSDGSDGKARAGHSAERVASMLSAPMLIGDDEQYAVAMALMARQLGIPARVVMGFYPDAAAATSGPLTVKGTMAHAWVEVPFDGAGWLSFDPTPDRTRVPQTLVPRPQPVPKPQVLPPPDPPVNKANDPLDDPGKKKDEQEKKGDDLLLRIALGVGIGAGVVGLIGSPFLVIGALKRRRRERRRNAEAIASRVSGGWAELVDGATDLGARISPVATRREASAVLAAAFAGVGTEQIAAAADAGVFGAAPPSMDAATAVWTDVDRTLASMRGQVGRWRRIRAFVSLRSFGPAAGSRVVSDRTPTSGGAAGRLAGVTKRLARKGS